MSRNRDLEAALIRYLPGECVPVILNWFNIHPVVLRISRSRRSRLGDFRGGTRLTPPVISVNHNLNKYSFLVTLLHEMAHAEVFFTHRGQAKPHGEEWKNACRVLGKTFRDESTLPDDFRHAFAAYLENPSASSTTNARLSEVLRRYDPPGLTSPLSELEENAFFVIPGGRVFRKGKKMRTRYRCECLNNKRIYLFSPLAEILPVDEPGRTGSQT